MPTFPETPLASDWETLWAAALQIAARRRGGERDLSPLAVDADRKVTWRDGEGWQLSGTFDERTRELFALYRPLLDQAPGAPPWVVAQLGQSLDGCIATHGGDSCFVTGPDNLDHLHRLRALCDAVIVGAGTVAADDPRLTTRRVPGPNPTRVVLDPALRVPPTARVLQDGAAPTLWLCDARSQAKADALKPNARVVGIAGLQRDDGTPDAQAVVATLHALGLNVLFVEGGGATVSSFVQQGALDRLHLAVAPVLIGAGRRGLALPAFPTMADCLRPPCRVLCMGDDVLWDLALRDA